MKTLVGAAIVLSAALLPVEVLADAQLPFSASRFDGAQLFRQYRRPPPAPPSAPSNPALSVPWPAPTVKCGMTMIPGDPKIDPGILKPQVRGSARFTIRAVEPALCR